MLCNAGAKSFRFMKEKKPLGQHVPNDSDDVLETAEVVRSCNCLLRMAVGIFGFANTLCAAEVFSESEAKSLDGSVNAVFKALEKTYASLMGRYSALKSSDIGKNVN